MSSGVKQEIPAELSARLRPHELECLIQRGLQSYAGLEFSSLTVHQCSQGVCLEGLLVNNHHGVYLCDVVRQIASVPVINHVVMRPRTPK